MSIDSGTQGISAAKLLQLRAGFAKVSGSHPRAERQSVRQLPACERIVVGVSAGHWLILRGCPAERQAVSLLSEATAGHCGKTQ